MPQGHGEIDGLEVSKNSVGERLLSTIDVYIGVFFDGTNNNMMQAMIGQKFRRDKVFDSHADIMRRLGYNSANEVIAKPRTHWENVQSGVFTKSDLDQLYGGTSLTNSDDLEQIIVTENNKYSYSSVEIDNNVNPINFKMGGMYKRKIQEIASSNSTAKRSSLPDMAVAASFSQGSTYTNPCILWSIYSVGEELDPQDDKHLSYHHRVYVEGSGADSTITTASNIDGSVDNIIGLGFGVGPTGVSAKCRKMVKQINNIYGMYHRPDVAEIRMHFDVFGFSRGATAARIFTYIVDPKNEGKVADSDYMLFTGEAKPFLPLKENDNSSLLTMKEVRMLGIYDTVASIGILRDPLNATLADVLKINGNIEFSKYGKSQYHDRNVDDFGLYATTNAKDVIHFCALDENRVNFSLTDIESSISSGNGTEIFLPGCHTDIGGGASLGQDDIKVVNKEAINSSEVFGSLLQKVKNAKVLADQAKKTINSAKTVTVGVKSIVSGIRNIGYGNVTSGLLKTMDGVTSTYEGVRQSITDAHLSVQMLRNTLMDVESDAEGCSGTKRVPQSFDIADGTDDFAKKGVIEHLADFTGNQKMHNAAKQKDKLIKGGNTLVDSVGKISETAKRMFGGQKSIIEITSAYDMVIGTLDNVDQNINSFMTVLNEINSAAFSVSTMANAIKGLVIGKDSIDTSVATKIGSLIGISDKIIHECGNIKNDIAISKDTLETLRLFKDELTKKSKLNDQQVLKNNIDNVNDVLDGIEKSLANCNTTVSGVQTMLQGLDSFQEHVNVIEGANSLIHGIVITYEGARDVMSSITQTSTGIWSNMRNLYQNTMQGFITPNGVAGQDSGQDLNSNFVNVASGLEGIDSSYDRLSANIKQSHDKLREIGDGDFGSIKGIENSIYLISIAIQSTVSALDNLKSMMDSTRKVSSNVLGIASNIKVATSKGNLLDDLIGSAKKSFSEFVTPATGSDISSNLTNMAAGLTDSTVNYCKAKTDIGAVGDSFWALSNHNYHSVKGILNAFSDVSRVISNSLSCLNDFKSMLESAKQTTTNTLGLGINMASSMTKGVADIIISTNDIAHPGNILKDYLIPYTGLSNSVIENMAGNIKNILSGIDIIKSGYTNALVNSATAVFKVKGLKDANLHSVKGIANALTDSASAIDSAKNAFDSVPSILDGIKRTSINIVGLGKNLQHAFTKENGQFVIVNECSNFINNKCDEMKKNFNQAKETATMLKELITGEKPVLPKLEKRELCFYNFYPCSKIDNPLGPHGLMPVSLDSLRALGWVDANTSFETDQTRMTGRAKKESLAKGDTVVIEGTKAFGIKRMNNIGIYKYVYPGYSNITLKLMIDWCKRKNSTIFNSLNEMRYAIPSDLTPFYEQIEQSCLNLKGRFFCVPKYEDIYRKVRMKYLHFSMNQQLISPADNILVNGPSMASVDNKYVIIRRIYIGKEGSPTAGSDDSHVGQLKYLYDYYGCEGTLKEFDFGVTNVIVSSEH